MLVSLLGITFSQAFGFCKKHLDALLPWNRVPSVQLLSKVIPECQLNCMQHTEVVCNLLTHMRFLMSSGHSVEARSSKVSAKHWTHSPPASAPITPSSNAELLGPCALRTWSCFAHASALIRHPLVVSATRATPNPGELPLLAPTGRGWGHRGRNQ